MVTAMVHTINASSLVLQASHSHVLLQVLMDPVCMLTCFPQLLHNFVYQMPSLAGCLGSVKGLANNIRCLIARDMIIAEVRSPVLACKPMQW